MSPEMIRGEPVDLRSDIYACGALLFELLTGRPPYRADSALAVMRKHLEDPVPSARRVARAVPAGVAKVAARAMAKLPADRHQTAGEFLAELEQAASRDYGADWESRASIKAAVATAIAAGAQP
jgi:serine/threonine-protein kinase